MNTSHLTSRPFLSLRLFAGFCLIWGGLFMMMAAPALAQSPCDEALSIAKREYEEGYFDEASFRLYACLGQGAFDAEREKEAYLLLGKIHFANLEMDKARDSVRTLLTRDPSLELDPSEYKPGFVDLVHEVMAEMESQGAPPLRSGFWLSLGIGPAQGAIQCECPLPDDDVWRGGGSGSFFISGGGTVNPNLQVGAELSVWRRDEANRSSTISLLSALAKFYPGTNGRFFLKGGIGLGGARLEASAQNVTFDLQSGGVGIQFGLGYDIVLGQARKMAITPTLTLSAVNARAEPFVFNDTRFGGAKNPSFIQLGVGVIWL